MNTGGMTVTAVRPTVVVHATFLAVTCQPRRGSRMIFCWESREGAKMKT